MAATRSTAKNSRSFYERYVQAVQHTGNRAWDTVNRWTHGYVSFLAQAIQNFITKGTTEAVVFGYWATFSLFPLVMLAIVSATFIFGADLARTQVYSALNNFIPGGGSVLIRENIEQAFTQRGGFGIISIIGLLYGATGLFRNLQFNLSRIFRDKQQRSVPLQFITGIMMLMTLAVLIGASIIASTLFTIIGGEIIGEKSPLMTVGAALLPLAINTIMFLMLFRFIPQNDISWRALIPAAIFAGLAWELSKNLFGWYVSHLANFGVMYGSLGTVMGLLTWTYLTGCFISLCAEIAVATDDWLAKRPPAVTIVKPDVNKPLPEVPASAQDKVVGVKVDANQLTTKE
jgi:membrane protein